MKVNGHWLDLPKEVVKKALDLKQGDSDITDIFSKAIVFGTFVYSIDVTLIYHNQVLCVTPGNPQWPLSIARELLLQWTGANQMNTSPSICL